MKYEEAKRKILEENPDIAKDAELETIHATAEQQEEMDRLLK